VLVDLDLCVDYSKTPKTLWKKGGTKGWGFLFFLKIQMN
jgi:hypothetical protein